MELNSIKVLDDSKLIILTVEQIDSQKSLLSQDDPGIPLYSTSEGYKVIPAAIEGSFVIPLGDLNNLLQESVIELDRRAVNDFTMVNYYQFFETEAELLIDIFPSSSKDVSIPGFDSNFHPPFDRYHRFPDFDKQLYEIRMQQMMDNNRSINLSGTEIKIHSLVNLIHFGIFHCLNMTKAWYCGGEKYSPCIPTTVFGLLLFGHLLGLAKEENKKMAEQFLARFGINNLKSAIDYYYI